MAFFRFSDEYTILYVIDVLSNTQYGSTSTAGFDMDLHIVM